MFFEEKNFGSQFFHIQCRWVKTANNIDWSSPNYTFLQIVAHGGREEELAGCGERKKKYWVQLHMNLGWVFCEVCRTSYQQRFGLLGLLLVKEIAKNSQPPSCELCSCTKNAKSIYYHNLCTYVCILQTAEAVVNHPTTITLSFRRRKYFS